MLMKLQMPTMLYKKLEKNVTRMPLPLANLLLQSVTLGHSSVICAVKTCIYILRGSINCLLENPIHESLRILKFVILSQVYR